MYITSMLRITLIIAANKHSVYRPLEGTSTMLTGMCTCKYTQSYSHNIIININKSIIQCHLQLGKIHYMVLVVKVLHSRHRQKSLQRIQKEIWQVNKQIPMKQ